MRMIIDIICVKLMYKYVTFFIRIIMRINDLVAGDRVRLVNFGTTDVVYRRRLLSLGVTRGVDVLIVRVAPLGCPLQVDVRGTSLTLRKEEAAELEWERI